MRIFIDGRVLNSNRFSGVTGYAKQIIKSVLDVDDRNEYLLFINSFSKKVSFNEWQKYPNVRLLDFRIPNRLFESANFFLNWPKIDDLCSADVFYSPHWNILSFREAGRRILTVHDLSFVHFPEFFSWRGRLWHYRQAFDRQLKKAGRIIVNADFTKNDIEETFGLKSENIERIYPGVDSFYQSLKEEALIDFRSKNNLKPPFLLYLGVLEPRKNVIAIIKAFGILKKKYQFKDLALIIAGPKGWLYDRIFKEARQSDCSCDIKILGQVSKMDALYLYNSASAFVYPSFFEGFGFPPLEAQACGLPVVASNRASLPEVLRDSALLVDPWRIEELIFALESVLLSPGLRTTLKERGFQNVKRFSWQKTAGELLNLFEQHAKKSTN